MVGLYPVRGAKQITMKDLDKALRKDKDKLAALEGNDKALSKWFDKFDPRGEIGIDIFKRHLKAQTGVTMKQYIHQP